jgi:hypothetical protein
MSTIDATGGTGGNNGTNGRFVLGQNNADTFVGTVTGATMETYAGWTDLNPYISRKSNTPMIPDLVGGAESYGLTTLSAANNFAAVVSAAPKSCPAALVHTHIGPGDYDTDFLGYDAYFFVNLSGQAVTNPLLGFVADDYFTPLAQQGQANNPLFGGTGPQTLGQLAADQVFETLAPIKGTSVFNMALSLNGKTYVLNDATTKSFVKVGSDTVLYLVPSALATNVTSQVKIVQGALTKAGKNAFKQTVTITNNGTKTITGPLAYVIDSLPSTVTVTKATGTTMTTSPTGSPYLDFSGSGLLAGATATITVQFSATSAGSITYTARVLNGPGSR